MKIIHQISFPLLTCFLAVLATGISLDAEAQRFGHPSFGGGGGGRSAPSRPAYTPAPAAARRPEASPEPARTINGGSRNVGTHVYTSNVNVHENVNVHSNVNAHDNVNVYHTGGYHGLHPYYYHPYHPFYWGPRWHPFGFFLPALTADAVLLSLAGGQYYYDDGCYYQPANGGYSVVPPPIGAVVSYLPQGYETTMVGNQQYYYYGGAFYVYTGNAYQVVAAPLGAVVTQIPVGAQDVNINGQDMLVYNNTYYLPISQNGEDAYEVVSPN